jgi:Glycosyltransferase family 87
LVWPPAAWSLCQLTPIWLAGLVLAWRLQSRPALAGVAIGVASLTKLLPALALGPFVWRRQWGAIVGFVAVWATALGLLAALGAPGAWTHYLTLMISVGREQAARDDNAALWLAARARWGGLGLVATGTLVAAVLVQAVGRLRQGREIEFTVFGLWVWLTIAFLPIAWDYSLLPILPWLVVLVWQGRPLAALLGGLALALPTVPWAEDNSLLITGALAAAGLALSWQVAGLGASPPRDAPRQLLAAGPPEARFP